MLHSVVLYLPTLIEEEEEEEKETGEEEDSIGPPRGVESSAADRHVVHEISNDNFPLTTPVWIVKMPLPVQVFNFQVGVKQYSFVVCKQKLTKM